ncbi:two-component system, OmpR family, sensor histidine kinase BaeS [Lentzea fradiae]|uniref:histidine kinase n=1 Tax=Lentzea fradiae TaxID=200378 RepID=A0A1G7SH34_9PSEU|nr:HAMP domain-containing sensor histidine kinase [Lentzea fradiae]SDG21530.1 two-component system, OmpR family, sensor histidine kinase BaeS [Lentzea fradiae]
MRRRPRGLLVLLLIGTVLVSACAIAATAWLSVQSTTQTLRDEQGRDHEGLARFYDALLGFGATHPSWSGVVPLLEELSEQTGLRIRLTTPDRVLIGGVFDSGDPRFPEQPAAVIDPLNVDVSLRPGSPQDRIDPRAAGPLRLQDAERAVTRANAEADVACAREKGEAAEIRTTEPGRSYAWPVVEGCWASDRTTAAEDQATGLLNSYLERCQDETGAPRRPVTLSRDGEFDFLVVESGVEAMRKCVAVARRALLSPYVAPAALLFVAEDPAPSRTVVGLPAAGAARIALAAALVLVLAGLVSYLLAGRVLRPLAVLTSASQRMRAGDLSARAEVRARWEVAELAAAFNDMAAHLASEEAVRKNLVNDVSHELRTPLATIRGWLVAAQGGVADLDDELLQLLLDETLVLQQLVDDLQELAAADAGELRLRPEVVDVAELVSQVAAAHRAEAEVPGDGLLTVVDPLRLRQVIRNLVVNAVQHTPEDGRVVVRARRSGDEVVIEVADTGHGISAEDLPHVFDRFWRADRSRTRATGGRGLGLAIVKHYVVAHGGTVDVSSEVGAGTTFVVRLPAKEPE